MVGGRKGFWEGEERLARGNESKGPPLSREQFLTLARREKQRNRWSAR